MTERYITYDEFDLYTRSETVEDASLKADALEAAFISIDNALHRRVELAVAGPTGLSTRTFRSLGWRSTTLWLDDFTELTSLVDNGTELTEGTHFVLEPLNGLSDGGEPRPYDRAVRYGGWWSYYNGPLTTVTIEARWGWPEIPPLVKEACKVVAKAILQGREIKFGIVALAETGAFGERDGKVVKDVIRDYTSHKAAAAMIA